MSAISNATNQDDAAVAVRGQMYDALAPVSSAVKQAIAAQTAMRNTDDLLPTMQAAIGVILALEAMHTAAKQAEVTARQALAEAMSLGCTTIQAGAHTASLRDAPQTAVVTHLADLPVEFLTTPSPRPDLPAIRKALLKGQVPGATLSNGGAATVQIRSK